MLHRQPLHWLYKTTNRVCFRAGCLNTKNNCSCYCFAGIFFPLLFKTVEVGMVTKPSTDQTQDFSIHNEDFPALPGPNYKDPTLNNDDSKTVSESHSGTFPSTFFFFRDDCRVKNVILILFLHFNCLELELHKQEHIQHRWSEVPWRQDDLGTEQQPEERDPGVARW